MRNLQILIVSAVKMCNKCLQTVSPYEERRTIAPVNYVLQDLSVPNLSLSVPLS